MTKSGMNRRQFLKFLGLSSTMLIAAESAQAWDWTTRLPLQNTTTSNTLTEPELVSQFREKLNAIFEGKEMALDFRRINPQGLEEWRIQIQNNDFYPVASAFKAFLVLYYFLKTPTAEWKVDPKAPVYRVSVYSNNTLTGTLLQEVADRSEAEGNAIEKFNNFLMEELKMSEGIYAWDWRGTVTIGQSDQRFRATGDRYVLIGENRGYVPNVSTATDLATGWTFIATAETHPRWEEDEHFRLAIMATREILSIPAAGFRSPIERVVYGGYTGKEGTLPVGDVSVGRVLNDAGIIRTWDGSQYVVAFMSTGETEGVTDPALTEVVNSIRDYQQATNPLRDLYIGGTSVGIIPNELNYGFVRSNDIEMYLEPDSTSGRVDNPMRRSSTFGTPYVMRGSLLRFTPVNDQWVKLEVDNHEDDAFTYLDWTYALQNANWSGWDIKTRKDIYIPLDHLKVIGREHFEAIDYATDRDEPTDKWMLLDIPHRHLTLFEGGVPLIKTPIVLNSLATPTGRLYINRVMCARNMPTYPGVPYSNFLHNNNDLNKWGFAIHGAPWHLWEQTVTEWETIRRYSHGCINIPGWTMPIGSYQLPVDEFIFRWVGGFPNPGAETTYFKKERVYVMSFVNPYEEILPYSIYDFMVKERSSWGDMLRAWEETPLSAPESFYNNPYSRRRESVLKLFADTNSGGN